MDDAYWGYILYVTHVVIIYMVVVAGMYYPRVVLFLFFPIYLYHVMFGGCPLTRLERSLHKKDITVIDPIIRMIGQSVNRQTRQVTQAMLSTILLFFLIYNSIMST